MSTLGPPRDGSAPDPPDGLRSGPRMPCSLKLAVLRRVI